MTSYEQIGQNDEPIDDKDRPPSAIKCIADTLNCDIYIFSGPLYREQSDLFMTEVENALSYKSDNCILIISTFGGDPDSAYVIARMLKHVYKKFYIYIFGVCKSAGTLLVLGADEIIMSHRGELGPLDVQVLKDDELIISSSGLDISKAINSLRDRAFEIFESNFLELKRRSGGNITTRTAGEIATSLAVGLIAPITAQIDPLKLGEIQRAIDVAYHYGVRLGADPEIVVRLIKSYPSHSFVIDFKEAKELLDYVRYPNELEFAMENELRLSAINGIEEEFIRLPHSSGFIASYIKIKEELNKEIPNDSGKASAEKDGDIRRKAEPRKKESLGEVDTDGRLPSEDIRSENQDK